jgi:hypothetical protein
MKAAADILDEIVSSVRPRKGCVISIAELPPDHSPGTNWREGADPGLRPDELYRLRSTADLLHRQQPFIDWSAIPTSIGRRQIVKSL